MPGTRSYDDPCGIARALDGVGDRWAILVIRELIFGPKRFLQLRSGLRSVSPNVLSQRLRDLEDAGIVRRGVLDPPASVAVYELTERGRALEPVLLELGRWGSRQPITTSSEMSADALLLALKTAFDPAAAADATFAIDVDGGWFTVIVSAGEVQVTRGRAAQPAVTRSRGTRHRRPRPAHGSSRRRSARRHTLPPAATSAIRLRYGSAGRRC